MEVWIFCSIHFWWLNWLPLWSLEETGLMLLNLSYSGRNEISPSTPYIYQNRNHVITSLVFLLVSPIISQNGRCSETYVYSGYPWFSHVNKKSFFTCYNYQKPNVLQQSSLMVLLTSPIISWSGDAQGRMYTRLSLGFYLNEINIYPLYLLNSNLWKMYISDDLVAIFHDLSR